MKLATIDFDEANGNSVEELDDDRYQKMVCPKCGEIWVEVEGGSAEIKYDTKCKHLKFIIEQAADEVAYLNGLTEETLLKAVEQAHAKVNPVAEKMSGGEILQEDKFNDEIWKMVELEAVDTLLDFTQSGIACGPVSYTIYFGARLIS